MLVACPQRCDKKLVLCFGSGPRPICYSYAKDLGEGGMIFGNRFDLTNKPANFTYHSSNDKGTGESSVEEAEPDTLRLDFWGLI